MEAIMLYGFNTWNWTQGRITFGGVTAQRVYFPPPDGVPNQWPQIFAGLVGVVSIRPDVESVASGALDAELMAFMRTAPSGSWLTLWHEANSPHHNLNPAIYKAAIKRVHDLVTVNTLPVHVGQILECYPVSNEGQDLTVWVQPGVHFYLIDGYQVSQETPDFVFGGSVRAIRAVYPQARLGIAETNSLLDVDTWAHRAWTYARLERMHAFLMFSQDATAPPPVFINLPSLPVLTELARLSAQS